MDEGIRRIVLEELELAIGKIGDADVIRDDTVHEVRKHCKKLRGALRLVRSSFDGYASENRRVRDAARLLSGTRDARVLADTRRELVGQLRLSPDDTGVRKLAAALARHTRIDGAQAEAALGEVRDRLAAVAGDVAGWDLSGDGFEMLSGGVKKTYKRARKAGRRCLENPSTDALHDWRKRVKYHWYHLRLLAGAWPRVLKAREVATHHLSSLLGDDHDLAVFGCALDDVSDDVPRKLAASFRNHIAIQRRLLQQESFAVGTRLFAERAPHFVERMETYWEVWRQPGASRVS